MLGSLVVFAALLSTVCSQPTSGAERHQVIVVGAGVSGFTAAATLLENNVTDILILEASDRIGGRIHTVQFGGVPIDKGAEFVHGQVGNAVYELVSPHDFLTSYMPYMEPAKFLFVNTTGHIFNSSYVFPLIYDLYEILNEEGMSHFKGSAAGYFYPRLDATLKAQNVEPKIAQAVRHHIPLLEGIASSSENLETLGAWGNLQYIDRKGDQAIKWKTGGYKTLFDFLSKKFYNASEELPVVNKTTFGKEVTRVEQKDGGVEMKCADGSTYLADHVIVTVSLGVLKKHAATMFHPPLSENKTAAIKALGIGCVAKVFMLFPTRWWPEDINVILPLFSDQEREAFKTSSTHGYWTVNSTGFYPVINHDRMLCAWLASDACRVMESLYEQQVIDGLMELLQKLLGSKFDIPKPEAILRTEWGSYPYTLGTYSYRTPESDLHNLTNSNLEQPVLDGDKPVVMFAGEATHLHYFSTVDGALGTGRREANRLLNYFKSTQQTT